LAWQDYVRNAAPRQETQRDSAYNAERKCINSTASSKANSRVRHSTRKTGSNKARSSPHNTGGNNRRCTRNRLTPNTPHSSQTRSSTSNTLKGNLTQRRQGARKGKKDAYR